MTNVAVLDIGKTNVKLSAVSRGGAILETLSTASGSLPGPLYRHLDLAGTEDWLFEQLPLLARRHPIGAIVATCHGSAGVLVDEDGPVLPMMDYEETVPQAVDEAYRKAAGPIEERGSPFMAAAAHLARQLFWMQAEWPQAVARARYLLGGPQYWAWRLSGVAASEVTYLAAQSQLWNVPGRRFTAIVAEQGWRRLLPDLQPAWKALGRLKPELARRLGLPGEIEVLCGIHDSSANFYRYQAAGLRNLAVISTGTWIVGLERLLCRRQSGPRWRPHLERHGGRRAADRHPRHGRPRILRHCRRGRRPAGGAFHDRPPDRSRHDGAPLVRQ